MVVDVIESEAEMGAEEGRGQLRVEFTLGIGLVAEDLRAVVDAEARRHLGRMGVLVEARGEIGLDAFEAFKGCHRDPILAGAIAGPPAALGVAYTGPLGHRLCERGKRVAGLGPARAVVERARVRAIPIGEPVDLAGVEDGEGFEDAVVALVTVGIVRGISRILGAPVAHGTVVSDRGRALALADLPAELRSLSTRHPMGRAVAMRHGAQREEEDVDAAIGGALVAEQQADLRGLPGLAPRVLTALVEPSDDLVGDLLGEIAAGFRRWGSGAGRAGHRSDPFTEATGIGRPAPPGAFLSGPPPGPCTDAMGIGQTHPAQACVRSCSISSSKSVRRCPTLSSTGQ
ncbi:MAG: hypothetical protein AAGG47_19120 [Pseudomonadota bacterium]